MNLGARWQHRAEAAARHSGRSQSMQKNCDIMWVAAHIRYTTLLLGRLHFFCRMGWTYPVARGSFGTASLPLAK